MNVAVIETVGGTPTVTNVVVLEHDADLADWVEFFDGATLVALDDHLDGCWGIGWTWDGDEPIEPELEEA